MASDHNNPVNGDMPQKLLRRYLAAPPRNDRDIRDNKIKPIVIIKKRFKSEDLNR